MKKLTKTKFVQYLECPHRFHLLSSHPELQLETTESDLFTIEEGFHFEEVVQTFFKNQEYKPHEVFQTDKHYAEADIVKLVSDKGIEIYEVKASTLVKPKYIWDIAFQKQIAELCGFKVSSSFLVLANKEYVFDGRNISSDVYRIEDVSEKVSEYQKDISPDIELAHNYLNGLEFPAENVHSCKDKHKCDYIIHKDSIPEYHIGLIPRLNKEKFFTLWKGGVKDIKDLSEVFPLSDAQKVIVQILKNKDTLFHKTALEDWMNSLEYPLYFLDYETYAPAVPVLENYKPYEKMVIQYSLHKIKDSSAGLEHYEFLVSDDQMNVLELVRQLEKDIGVKGSVLVWNESFEKNCNDILAAKYPVYSSFLAQLNSRIVDQMKIFKDLIYYDYRFKGSNSIKNVLPVLVPELNYKDMNVQQGDIASYRWKKAIVEKNKNYPRDEVITDLLSYCKLDTLAMVKIHIYLLEKLVE